MQITDNIDAKLNNYQDFTISELVKPKNYRVKNSQWHCKCCDIYCNSQIQFEVHLISQKHKQVEKKQFSMETSSLNSTLNQQDSLDKPNYDENNNSVKEKPKYTIDIHNFSIAEASCIQAQNYLIPESKKVGKFEKFGFYCSKCDAYMTGQIQLVMHVKGSKHQFYCPGEIPGYVPSKVYNPTYKQSKYTNQKGSSLSVKTKTNLMSTPVKPSQTGSYMDYLIKNQTIMQHSGQYYAPRYYTPPMATPVYNQFNHVVDQVYSKVFSGTTPSTPNVLNQTNRNQGCFGAYNPTPVFGNNTQPIRIITTTPSTHNLIVLNNNNCSDNMETKTNTQANGDSMLNRSFESAYGPYNNFEQNSNQLFNQPQLHHYNNGVAIISKQQQQQQPYFSQQNTKFILNHQNDTSSTGISPPHAYYQQQTYSFIN